MLLSVCYAAVIMIRASSMFSKDIADTRFLSDYDLASASGSFSFAD